MAMILMAAYTNYRRDPRVRREAEALVEEGHRVVFLASRQRGEPDRETLDGVQVIKLRSVGNQKTSMAVYVLDYALFAWGIFWHLLLHPRRYQLVHINNMPDFLVFATVPARLLGVPVIYDVHDLMPELFLEKFEAGERHWMMSVLRWQERWAGQLASAVLTVEERLKDILSSRGIPREKIHVLMNLPDDRIFKPRPETPSRQAGDPFVLVYHGTLARRLGLDIAIEAVAKARASGADVRLRVIGAGEERAPLIALRNRLRLQDVVSFSDGFVPVQQIPAMIADADAGIVPLRISAGTDIMLPTKLLEYTAIGIPCLAPKTGTIARYFDDSMIEYFRAEDSDDLAAAIARLARDPQRCASIAREATARFGKTHTWRHHRNIYTELVRAMIDRPVRPRV